MKYTITLDTGTTNSRCILWDENRQEIAVEKRSVGVRNTAIDGNNNRLKEAVKSCLDTLLNRNNITYDDIKCIIASGMITSNVGLVEVPHIVAPASKEDLAQAITPVLLEDIAPIPFFFIPGVKNYGGEITMDIFRNMDTMRGEEVESVAIIEHYPRGKEYLLVLPGSHTKFVSVDKDGRITGCLTTISGELMSSIVNNTIIADAVGHKFVEMDTYDKEMLLVGYDTANEYGIGHACFLGRILSLFTLKDKTKVANYITGVTLQNDIIAIKNSSTLKVNSDTTVIVGGSNPMRTIFVDILKHDGYYSNIEAFENSEGKTLAALGSYIIADLCHFS